MLAWPAFIGCRAHLVSYYDSLTYKNLTEIKADAALLFEALEKGPNGTILRSEIARVRLAMGPRIPDGGWCLFRSPGEGGRRGRVVLVQHRDIEDPETGGSYTVKRYESEKESDGSDGWRHTEIRLLPENPDFAPLILRGVRDDEFHVIAEGGGVLP